MRNRDLLSCLVKALGVYFFIHGAIAGIVGVYWFVYYFFLSTTLGGALRRAPYDAVNAGSYLVFGAFLFYGTRFVVSRAIPPGHLCPECNYDLRETTSDRCPECGIEISRAPAPVANFSESPKTDRSAEQKLVFYILGSLIVFVILMAFLKAALSSSGQSVDSIFQ